MGTGAKLQEFEHGGLVWSVALSARGKNLATGCRDKKARVFDLETGAKLQEFEHGGLVPELFDLDFEKILQNFHEIGNIPKSKLMMGFGVGDQDAGAKWEGMDKDVEVFKYLKKEQYGGGFIWAV